MELKKPDGNQYRLIVELSPNMIWRAGLDTLCDYFNTTWLNFTGRTLEQEAGTGWAEGVHPDDFDDCLKIYLDSFALRESFEMEYRLRRHDGEWRWINDRGVPFYNDEKEFSGYIGSCMDVTDKVEGQKMRELAQRDGLTGIKNRQYFEQLAKVEFSRAKRFGTDLCITMIDIDAFKMINDTYGHFAGDLVLKEVARIIAGSVREFDIAGRYGGDEFIVLLSNIDKAAADGIIMRVDAAIKEIQINYNGQLIHVSASFGTCQLTMEETLEKVIIEADKMLYENKKKSQKSR